MTADREIPFVKLHGAANDYVCIQAEDVAGEDLAGLAQRACNRRRGVGADGLLILEASDIADYRMLIYNSDGSRPEMCGNGLRCLVKFALDREIGPREGPVTVETDAGVLAVDVRRDGRGRVVEARIDLGAPRWRRSDIPVAGPADGEALELRVDAVGEAWTLSAVSFGNPHAVIRVNDVDVVPLEVVGPAIERHPLFPKGTNVELVTPLDRSTIRQRTWERGVGETLACGTGAAAVAVVASRLGWCDRSVDVELRGGRLHVDWCDDDRVLLTGPAEEVFTGRLVQESAVGQ